MEPLEEGHRAASQRVLEALDLPGLRVVADGAAVTALEGLPGCRVPFAEALRAAVEAFLTDERGAFGGGEDTARARVRASAEALGLGPDPTPDAATGVLRAALRDDPAAAVVLLSATTLADARWRFPPEQGEDPAAVWVFRIDAPERWGILQWSIVDPRGDRAPYSYGHD